MERPIRFKVNRQKALEALAWLANEKPGLTYYYVAKILFFADKIHLQRYGRPVLGDRYIAMEHGPVPSFVYNLLKGEEFLAPDVLDSIPEAIEIKKDKRHPEVHPARVANMEVFSRTDVECLKEALERFGSLSVTALRELTHQQAAYEEAELNGEMRYDLMIDEDAPNREELIEHLRETAPYVAV